LFVAADPFLVVVVFRKIDVELVFSSHRVGGWWIVYNVNTIMFILYNKSKH
jgi:hypothetical protein